jgi:hypothetical protein
MTDTNNIWGWNSIKAFKLETWVPTFGNWCGPGWSGGQRTNVVTPDMITVGAVIINGRPSPIDISCMNHDISYGLAKGLANEAQLILQADLKLRQDIRALDWSILTTAESNYAVLMDLAFAAKIAMVDAPSVLVESIMLLSQSLTSQGAAGGVDPAGIIYTDQFGASLSCSRDAQGNLQLDCRQTLATGDIVRTQFDLQGHTTGFEAGNIGTGLTTNLYSLTTLNATVANWNTISDSTSSGPSSLGSILIASADTIASVDYSLLGDVNTVGGNAAIINYAITDGLRPGNDNLGLNINRSSGMGLKIPTSGTTLGDFSLYGTSLNNAAASNFQLTPTDPLVLDLNGDGVKLTNYTDAPVLFDADNDGGSLEQTGWISSADGIVVHDLNGDGKINNIGCKRSFADLA